ncbi:DUF6691 family protein [Brenneria populi subsp. brevivirga]|uniref:DUF6691 family protein n=1 Tax=Brenneria populi TaxID=1505588 RepID=A0ABU6JQ56_9GAMM|nr:DUF6691 family protein [Brenneria populi subsp. brevivirga]MEC5342878.1 DUF6691 family protein [Brenneria populi Li et al. 2015]
MKNISALLCGLTFGCGLLLSGMTEPEKVLGFLDIAGRWDPSLSLVMLAAVGMAIPAYALARRRSKTLLGESFHIPAATAIDGRLLAGAALFGVGWGLAGICPGPALVLLGSGSAKGALFTLSMLGGMVLFDYYAARYRK